MVGGRTTEWEELEGKKWMALNKTHITYEIMR